MRKSDQGDWIDPPPPPEDDGHQIKKPQYTGPAERLGRANWIELWAQDRGDEDEKFDAAYLRHQATKAYIAADQALGIESGRYAPQFSGPNQEVSKWQQIVDAVKNAEVVAPGQLEDAEYKLAQAMDRLTESQKQMLMRGRVGDFSGPYQDVQKWQNMLNELLSKGGTAEQIADANYKLKQAKTKLDEIEQKPDEGFWKNLADTLIPRRYRQIMQVPLPPKFTDFMSRFSFMGGSGGAGGGGPWSRVLAGNGGSGTLGALLAPIMGRITIPAIATAAALYLVVQAGKKLVDHIVDSARAQEEYRKAITASGSTAEQMGFFMAAGFSPSQAAQQAAGLRGRLFEDPFAIMASLQIGGSGMAAPRFSRRDINEGAILQQHIELLRQITDAEEQLYQARQLGLEGSLDVVKASDRQWERIKTAGEQTGQAGHTGVQRNLRDASLQWDAFNQSLQNFKNSTASMVAPAFNEILGFFTYLTNAAAVGAGRFTPGGSGIDPATQAIKDNTRELQRNTGAIAGQGIYGGGERVRGAIPAHMRGEMYRQAMNGASYRWGAFG
jgi:hypothetical protein